MSILCVTPFGEPAEAALRDAVGRAKGPDPLAPVTVCGPSATANLSLRRRLGRGRLRLPGNDRDGLVNVRFMPLDRAAQLMGAAHLPAGKSTLLTEALRSEFVRLALDDAPGALREVKGHPATAASLEATFTDLRESTDAELEAMEARGGHAADAIRVYRRFQMLTNGYFDGVDVLQAAAAAIGRDPSLPADTGHVVVYLPREVTPSSEAFLRALANCGRLTVILGLTGDPAADAPALRLRERLASFMDMQEDAAPYPAPEISLIEAPDPEEEVRCVIRRINGSLLAGKPLHRMAILYSASRPFGLIAHEQLEAAGIPHNGRGIRTLAQSLAGATLLGLLRLSESAFAREDVIDWLRGAPIRRTEGGPAVPDEAWARLARAAGVVKGLDQWESRLRFHAKSLAEEAQRLRLMDEGEDSPRIQRAEKDAAETQRLREFIAGLGKTVQPGGATSWRKAVLWARGALERYLGSRTDSNVWTPGEEEASAKIDRVLNELGALDALGSRAGPAALRRALERRLGVPIRHNRYGTGVFLGTVRQALGMRFDEVFVVGMNEAAFPRAAREDPLLPDRVRETGNVRLCVDQAAEDRRDYLAMLAAADRVTLACSRSDPRAGREQMPCAWYLDAASTLAGRRVFSRDLASFADSPWITAVPSFHDALLASPQPASVQEHRLGGMLHAWIRGDDAPNLPVALTHGLQCVRERAGETFTRWDGLLPAHAARSIRGRAPVSPTSLQTWAKCPFQYFLARVLRVAETDKPEDALEIRGKDRGEVYHRALEAFFRKRLGELMPDTAWTKDDQAELLEIAMEAARSLEAAGVGEAFSWRLEKGALRRGLRAFLQHDQQLRSSNRLHPVALEFSFGIGQEAGAGEIALEDGHTVRFMGRIDRVDRAGDGTLWVWDYKSGQAKHYAQMSADPVDHGKLLQLPVYALGIGSAFESEGIEARYWFITNPGSKGANIKGYPVDAAVLERFRHVIGVIASGIDGGVFAARPGSSVYGGFENCAFCPYDSVCHPDRERIWERKRSDPALAGYAALAEDQSI